MTSTQSPAAPPKLDLSNLNPLTMPPGPSSPQLEKDAARAMSSTSSWKPSFERKQSFSQEEQKRALQMASVGNVKEGPGFSERHE